MPIYSIGHSNHSWELFLNLVQGAGIDTIIDVRLRPRSRWPHFSDPALSLKLQAAGLSYIYLGSELGGRPADDVTSNYDQMAATPRFTGGLDQVVAVARRHTPGLLCAEHDPLTCHRALLVGRHLAARGAKLRHVLRDGRVETQRQMEDRLLMISARNEEDLLAPRAERLALAYRHQEAALFRSARRNR